MSFVTQSNGISIPPDATKFTHGEQQNDNDMPLRNFFGLLAVAMRL